MAGKDQPLVMDSSRSPKDSTLVSDVVGDGAVTSALYSFSRPSTLSFARPKSPSLMLPGIQANLSGANHTGMKAQQPHTHPPHPGRCWQA